MATARVSEAIEKNADEVFALLGNFGAIKSDLIKDLKMHGSGIGCIREITLADGAKLKERMENHDTNSRTLTYSIQGDDHPLPFKSYVATLIVTPTGPKQCRVDWFGNFEPKGVPEADAIKLAQGIYTGAIKATVKMLAG